MNLMLYGAKRFDILNADFLAMDISAEYDFVFCDLPFGGYREPSDLRPPLSEMARQMGMRRLPSKAYICSGSGIAAARRPGGSYRTEGLLLVQHRAPFGTRPVPSSHQGCN